MIRVGMKYQHMVRGLDCPCHSPQIRQVVDRLASFSRRGFLSGLGAALATSGSAARAFAQPAGPTGKILLRQLRLFDGTNPIREGTQVLIERNRIASVDTTNSAPPSDAVIIDCSNRVLMPGLIDAHWHALLAAIPAAVLAAADPGYIFTAATAEAERTLLRGFTTIRDLGGPVFSFKQAIDDGLIPGPRIYPSGAMITTSGGHGDLRMLTDLPRRSGQLSSIETLGGSMIADSIGEVQLRTREQLLQGASQLKLVGGGGVSSPRSPLDMTTFSETDLRAAVDVARDWNTYVTVHAYAPNTIRRAIAAGAACIEHAHLMDEDTARIMADQGVWLSIQPFLSAEDSVPLTGPSQDKLRQVIAGTDMAYTLARKHKIKTAFGSDLLFSATMAARQGNMLTHLTRWYANLEILRMATSTNAELLGLSHQRNPYPGKLGVIEEGAFADLLVIDGDPVENISLIENPDANLRLIMKDGKIHKNTLAG
ncbi:metal-dependent hydrolase family protein [Microvirga rosea]|uniref:metal-dependent hydrolase family protein n=1 Tax=Microvirga rosea TaxID=2715425 RepID=UPI001D0BABA5|nr:amidohydrolase family protein [Microvirga rosea]MCB8821830.1 amidohydrolase family protein [Microvirga rosea]